MLPYSPRSPHYIPVGCIGISRSEIDVQDAAWQIEVATWKSFLFRDKENTDRLLKDASPISPTNQTLQDALLNSEALRPCLQLLRANWAQLEYKMLPQFEFRVTIRVYILADDALRGSISRAHGSLFKIRGRILEQLDCSPQAWSGAEAPQAFQRSPFVPQSAQELETSLLELFNNIPSPAPDIDLIVDPFLNELATNVLQGNVHGLTSDLLPYQKRSVALMMQKEMYPGKVLDPRLLHLHDQDGHSWYLDPIAGAIFRDAKHYDGVSGGILAEDMGTGKTIICLALLLATRGLLAEAPEVYLSPAGRVRKSVGSLMDMAASCATQHSQPWMQYYGYAKDKDLDRNSIAKAIRRNPGSYLLPGAEPRRCGRIGSKYVPVPRKIYLASTSLVIVPNNLVSQWKQEIRKHTEDLEVLVLTKNDAIPDAETLLGYDVLLFSQSRFENLSKHQPILQTPLAAIHFKRCIVDEGHVLGNSKINSKSFLLLGLDALQVTSRWIVTGTPSRGLYGTSIQKSDGSTESSMNVSLAQYDSHSSLNQSSRELERKDLERLGSIAALYLKARPWANSVLETEDTLANWTKHLVPPKTGPGRAGRWECLKMTINSLIVRHQLQEVRTQLPPVNEKIVLLEGSYQDMLSLNIFAMMIIFNSVQSQRTDIDYFFHIKQRKSLLQIVHNLKQSSFFGGSFFTAEEIEKSVQTAEEFLDKKKIEISAEDEGLLRTAIDFGRLVLTSQLRCLSNLFHEMPICVTGFPVGTGKYWSLDLEESDHVCTSARMVIALQKLLYNAAGNPEQLNSLLNGGLIQEGIGERFKAQDEAKSAGETKKRGQRSDTLAGNTKLGDDSPKKKRSHGINGAEPAPVLTNEALATALAKTKLVSTVSAKLSYLIDGIAKHQDDEKIIVFYENENVAWYLASILDVLQIQHLIYARGLPAERRAQYVNTFHHNETFRVLLMDLSQAAFGLDMRAASRVYFINPVLNPQVESQAIARVRRISQQKGVSVETLVLKDSIDEVILDRKEHMTQAEHGKARTILDVASINNWIRNAKIVPVGEAGDSHADQMVPLTKPLQVFGKGFGRLPDPDDGLVKEEESVATKIVLPRRAATPPTSGRKRMRGESNSRVILMGGGTSAEMMMPPPARRVRFTAGSD
ncbi:SNF2 family helicase [Cordyceps fumosorosea ARSEF 2679]|uniref:SNF2 family helicase n=1 Tax=Cordyceps fumosorosea (strain ARSEF 2679) TaxID=1081104 RepID=A0A168EHY6_CORFA|nr:SNF2 family helicase [Cordyceps fumosorosea ARSEF 2679]OAA73828.1 SNF2 family helicase [Cordyceps fumosorosea ARSEF 2679]